MILHSPIFSGSINQAESAYANLSGSFTGSFKGVGDFEGLVADSIDYVNIFNAPTLVSGSSQISYPDISNIPSGIISSSAQIDTLFNIDGLVSGAAQVTSLLPTGVISGSSQVSADQTEGWAVDVKTQLNSNTVISGSSQVVLNSADKTGFDTDDVSEGSNLYYTDARVKTKLDAEGVISSSAQITITESQISDLDHYTDTDFDNRLATKSTTNLTEGTNLYYTDARVKTKLDAEGVISGSSQVSFNTIVDKPTLVSGSSQIDVTSTTNYSTISSHISNTSNPHSVTAAQVGLGNVTNESKATMFTSPTFTGTPVAPTAAANTNSTQIATTAYVQQELSDLIGGANEAFDTLLEISASLASGDSTLNTLVDGKLSKSSNLSDLTDASTARTNLGVAIGSDVQAYNSTLAAVAGGTYSGDDSITTIGTVTAGSVTAILPVGVVSGSAQVDHDSTTNFVADEHIAHSTVSITAGDGLTGGGTIAASRTINVVGTANRISVSADAVDIASTYVGQTSITTLGTIATGTWNGSVIASAYLDADTAHLTTTQTFSGAKTFSAAVNITDSTASTTKTTGALIVTGGVGVSGALNVGGDVVAYASSDKRLKDNIKNIENPIEKVQKLNGVTWDWNSNADELQQSLPNVGVIAQEVEEVFPQLVHNRDNGFKGVDYAKLTGLLIEAIKEQQKQIEELKSKLG